MPDFNSLDEQSLRRIARVVIAHEKRNRTVRPYRVRPVFRVRGRESGFYAKIIGKVEVQVGQKKIGKYQWEEVRPVYDPDSDAVSFQTFSGARSGAKAFEYQLSNANIHLAENNIVWLRPATVGEASVSSSSSISGGGGGAGSASSSSVSSSSLDDPPYVFDKGLTNEPEDLRLEI